MEILAIVFVALWVVVLLIKGQEGRLPRDRYRDEHPRDRDLFDSPPEHREDRDYDYRREGRYRSHRNARRYLDRDDRHRSRFGGREREWRE